MPAFTTAMIVTAVTEFAITAAVSIALQQIMKALQGPQKDAGRTVSFREAAGARRVIYGECLVGGVPTFLNISRIYDYPDQFFELVYTLSGHEIHSLVSVVFDGTPVSWGSWDSVKQMWQENATYKGNVWGDWKFGKPCEPAFPGLMLRSSQSGSNLWTATCRQDGCASVALLLNWNQNVFPNGAPSATFIVQGKHLFDPRTSTTAYSKNAALAIYDFLMSKEYGFGATAAEINTASVIAAADACDETVSLKAGGTELRYQIDGMFAVDAQPTDVLNALAQAMAGSVIFSQGQWYLIPGVWSAPVIALNDDDLRGPIQMQTLRPKRELCNAVQGTIFARELTGTAKFQKVNFPPVVHPVPLCQDSGHPNANQRGYWATATDYAVEDCTIDATARAMLGLWATGTVYHVNDYVRDTTTDGIYICTQAHTSSAAGPNPPTVNGNEPGVGQDWTSYWADTTATFSEFRGGVYVCTAAHTSSAATEPGIGATWASYWVEMTEYIWKDIELNFTTSSPRAQRIAKIILERTRHQTTAILKCKLSAFQLQPGDTFHFSHPRYGWDNETFQVLQSDFVIDDQNGTLGIDLKVQMVDASIYAWDPTAEEQTLGQPAQPTIPDTEIPRPTPAAYGPGLTWSSTTTTVSFAWDYTGGNAIILLDQGNTEYTPSGNQEITGLTANTAYKFYPYYNIWIAAFSGSMSDGIGTPKWLETPSSDPTVMRKRDAEWERDGNIPLALAPLDVSTPSSGSGGGGGGGDGGCLRIGMFVEEANRGPIRCEDVQVGDRILSDGRWLEVFHVRRRAHDLWVTIQFSNGAELTVTTGHPFTLALREPDAMKRASELSLEDAVYTPTGIAYPQSLAYIHEESEKVSITVEEPHTFYASKDGENWILTHNFIKQTF